MFYSQVTKAWHGRSIWLKIKNKYNLQKSDYVLVESTNDEELINYGNKYIKQFKEKNKINRCVVVREKDKKYRINEEECNVVECSRKQVDSLIAFWCLYYFTKRLIVFDDKVPDTNHIGNLVQSKILSKEEAVAIGLFGLDGLED